MISAMVAYCDVHLDINFSAAASVRRYKRRSESLCAARHPRSTSWSSRPGGSAAQYKLFSLDSLRQTKGRGAKSNIEIFHFGTISGSAVITEWYRYSAPPAPALCLWRAGSSHVCYDV
jgi:hypothetical protein